MDGWLGAKQGEESGFIKDRDSEGSGLFEFRASFFSGYQVAGFLADGAGDLAAGGFDHGFGGIAGEGGESAGEDEGEASELRGGDSFDGGHGEAEGLEVGDEGLVTGFGEELKERLRRLWGRPR